MWITQRHRHQCGNGQREGGVRAGGGWQREEMGTSVTVSTIKVREKKPRTANGIHHILMRTCIVVIVCLETWVTWTSILIISKARESKNLELNRWEPWIRMQC